jgi:hypothetical protein
MKHLLKIILIGALVFAFTPINGMANNDVSDIEQLGHDDDIYIEEIILTSEDIKKYTKDGKVIFNPQSLKNKDLYLTNHEIEVDLSPHKVSELEAEALEKGNEWYPSSIKVTKKFINENEEFIKVKDFKKLKKNKYILDEKSDKSTKINQVSISALNKNQPEVKRAYTYMTTYIQVWDEVNTSTNKKRHYLRSNHEWNRFAYGWVNTQDDDNKEDIAALAWSIGPTSYSDTSRDGYATWANYSGDKTIRETYNESDLHNDAGPNASAFGISDSKFSNGTYYGLKKVTLYAFTGWYTKGSIGEEGSVTGQYAHGFSSDSLSFSVGVGYPGSVSLSFTPTSTSVREVAKLWDTLNTD